MLLFYTLLIGLSARADSAARHIAGLSSSFSDAAAIALVDTALQRMGGAAALGAITQIRREMLTQWQSITFTDHPYADGPS